nr:MAG TPA: hypothetical protein [Bacteriophage sp.]
MNSLYFNSIIVSIKDSINRSLSSCQSPFLRSINWGYT